MEQGDHSECPVELRACPEHQQPRDSSEDEFFLTLVRDSLSDSEKLRCECGCAEAQAEEVVGRCVWCSHVYITYDTMTEIQHFLNLCPGAPEEIRKVVKLKLGRVN
jgi:hypothetical protein